MNAPRKRARGAEVDDTAQATTVTLLQHQPAVAELQISISADEQSDSVQLVDVAVDMEVAAAKKKVETAEEEVAAAKEKVKTAEEEVAAAKNAT
jgi:hypothetical protein